MKRLLCITASMNTGGAETFLMKIHRELDKEKYQMDYCVNTDNNYYEKEIYELGGKIFIIPSKSESLIKSFNGIKRIVKENNYDYVIRVNEHSLSVIDLIAAKCGGAKHLIMRSSNASSGSKFKYFLHKLFQFMPKTIPTIKIAPSMLAGEYTFGKKAVKNNEVQLIPNAIDLDKFKFSEEIRNVYRKVLNVEAKFVVGHIGRFSKQKNHKYLIDIFNDIHKENKESVLLLVGTGELENEIRKYVHDLDLDEEVIFLGIRSDIPQLLWAMDCFVFPSLYEGMPNTVIEAQATGLQCLISDTITSEVKVTDCVEMHSIKDNPSEWVHHLKRMMNKNYDRTMNYNSMKKNGYEIKDCIIVFQDIVFFS